MSEKFSSEDDEALIDLVRQHPPLYHVGRRSYKDLVVKNNIWKEIGVTMKKTEKACQARWKNIRDNYTKKKREVMKGQKTGSARNIRMENFCAKYRNLSFLDNTSIVERKSISNLSESEGSSESQDVDDLQVDGCIGSSSEFVVIHDCEEGSSELIEVEASPVSQDIANTHHSTVEEPVTPAETPSITRKRKPISRERERVLEEIKRGRVERTQLLRELLSQPSNDAKQEETAISTFFRSIALTVEKLPSDLQTRAKVKVLEVISELEFEQQQRDFSSSQSSSTGFSCIPHQYIVPTNQPSSFTASYVRAFSPQDDRMPTRSPFP